MEDFTEEILITKERIPILIGEKGKTKRQIERNGKIKLDINSKSNLVVIKGKDSMQVFLAQNVVEAIGRGFNPVKAQKLFKDGVAYDSLNLKDFGAKSKGDQRRLKGLVIGQEGKVQKVIEEYTKTDIAIYGKTISIIGSHEDVLMARRAIEMLLSGNSHGTVFEYLEMGYKPGEQW